MIGAAEVEVLIGFKGVLGEELMRIWCWGECFYVRLGYRDFGFIWVVRDRFIYFLINWFLKVE